MSDVARLESLAQQLAARVRDDSPEANLRWLRAELGTDPTAPISDEERLLFLLAAAYPIHRTWRQATAWTRTPAQRRRDKLADVLLAERYGPRPRRAA